MYIYLFSKKTRNIITRQSAIKKFSRDFPYHKNWHGYHRYALTTFESTFSFSKSHLILPAPCISENCIEIKIKLNFYLYTSLWCLERFYEDLKIKLNCYFHTSLWSSKGLKAFKAFIKPFEAKQRSVKIKI